MIEFKDITLADKELIQSCTLKIPSSKCDVSVSKRCFLKIL